MGVRNDQTGERDRGVQYGLHTVTGLCGGPEGGVGEHHKDLSVSPLHPESKCHRGRQRERERER